MRVMVYDEKAVGRCHDDERRQCSKMMMMMMIDNDGNDAG